MRDRAAKLDLRAEVNTVTQTRTGRIHLDCRIANRIAFPWNRRPDMA
jgi:hypothetical protein